jgi:hypothetical protein
MQISELHLGIVGAGGFARFAAEAFLRASGIKLIAVTDINQNAARQMSNEFGLIIYDDMEQMLADANINLIYIATPPYLHYMQSKMALLAGKHVVCEKPAAFKTSEAEELLELARSRQLLYVVNLMQRYNPLYKIVKIIIQEKILGNFLHGFFENYASDENMAPEHWFWDESKSGGIFIEHGVHFFDLFEGWLGEGRVAGAWQLQRPGIKEKIFDRVQATVLYNDGLVNFYHGFDQPTMLDRQEMRLEFECGEITMYEWVPVKMKLHGLLRSGQLQRLKEIVGITASVHYHKTQKENKQVKGRFCELVFEDHITLEYENESGKQHLYNKMLTTMIADQWCWIRNHNHIRVVDDNNAVQSLKMAEHANRMAKNFNY